MAASITNVAAPQVASPVPKPVPAAETKATAPVTEEAIPQVQPIEVNTADSREETQEDIREAAGAARSGEPLLCLRLRSMLMKSSTRRL